MPHPCDSREDLVQVDFRSARFRILYILPIENEDLHASLINNGWGELSTTKALGERHADTSFIIFLPVVARQVFVQTHEAVFRYPAHSDIEHRRG